jgi:hypothetical protein
MDTAPAIRAQELGRRIIQFAVLRIPLLARVRFSPGCCPKPIEVFLFLNFIEKCTFFPHGHEELRPRGSTCAVSLRMGSAAGMWCAQHTCTVYPTSSLPCVECRLEQPGIHQQWMWCPAVPPSQNFGDRPVKTPPLPSHQICCSRDFG